MCVMDRKVYLAITLISVFFLLGCEDNENEEYVSPYKDLVVTKEENIEKYLDKSRLDNNVSYTFDEAIENFSFVLYKDYLNLENLENNEITFSFNSNENVELFSVGINNYIFKYVADNIYREVNMHIEDYTIDNYKEEIEKDDYIIIKEENGYIFMEYNDSYSNTFYALKFFDDGTCLMLNLHDYSSSLDENAKQI